jgi:hypothetical protein
MNDPPATVADAEGHYPCCARHCPFHAAEATHTTPCAACEEEISRDGAAEQEALAGASAAEDEARAREEELNDRDRARAEEADDYGEPPQEPDEPNPYAGDNGGDPP